MPPPPACMLHPRFAEAYQASVKEITHLLTGDDTASAEARVLLDRVICTPAPKAAAWISMWKEDWPPCSISARAKPHPPDEVLLRW